MNKELLKQKAEALKELLQKYSVVNPEAGSVLISLQGLLTKAMNHEISAPIEWVSIPGAYQFNEGSLRQYKDLENAFAEFRIEVTGGEGLALKMFRQTSKGENI
ncbi:hypothetical protein [Luteibacter jiangsuensis]